MPFSRRHYRDVSPPADTPAQISARLANNEVLAQVRAEAAQRPCSTVPEVVALLAWQEDRIAELRRERGLIFGGL